MKFHSNVQVFSWLFLDHARESAPFCVNWQNRLIESLRVSEARRLPTCFEGIKPDLGLFINPYFHARAWIASLICARLSCSDPFARSFPSDGLTGVLLRVIRNKRIWFSLSLMVYTFGISGGVYDIIRNPAPFHMKPDGTIMWFHPQVTRRHNLLCCTGRFW